MSTIIDISIDCLNNMSDGGNNIDPNCNFQINPILKDSDGIEYYLLDYPNYFYKGIDKTSILEYNDPYNLYKNKPSWMSDLSTAYHYVKFFTIKKKKPYANIYVFKTIKSLKLFNLLSINNIKILYNKILTKINEIQLSIDSQIDNDNLHDELQKYMNYKLTIEATTGFNVTFEEQLVLNELNVSYFTQKKFQSSNGNIIKYRINNNLHSHNKEDLNRYSRMKTDYCLVQILIDFFPRFDGYCAYRTKTLSHIGSSFHEEICIFNPELCIRRDHGNILDANNSRNNIAVYHYLLGKSPQFKERELMEMDGGETNINDTKKFDDKKFDDKKFDANNINELIQNLDKIKDKKKDCDEYNIININQMYKELCFDLIKYNLDLDFNDNNHMYTEYKYNIEINDMFKHTKINKILKLYKLLCKKSDDESKKILEKIKKFLKKKLNYKIIM